MKNDAIQWRAGGVKLSSIIFCVTVLAAWLPAKGRAQVNSGSDGSDGALDYSAITNTNNIVIDMHDHPTGIYNYTYVNIPANVTVTFIPNTVNTPVVWLVQSNCIINGNIGVNGQSASSSGNGGSGGPGGFAGGNVGGAGVPGGNGLGPGGGIGGTNSYAWGCGSYATTGQTYEVAPGPTYGNLFIFPLIGGSGGGGSESGSNNGGGGGGGGGAILIAASGSITFTGSISANGGGGCTFGSGGAVRLVASTLSGGGSVSASGRNFGGNGWVRFDAIVNTLSGSVSGQVSRGFQPIILPAAGQVAQLFIASVAGISVSATPGGQLLWPDAILSGQQANPIPIVVNCSNLPLNTQITVTVTPANGSSVSAVGYNNTGTLASSTATVSLNIPRGGGGYIYATAATAQ